MKELGDNLASNTDGEVIIVFDLETDSALLTKRTARELVNRFQKLRKKAGLLASDTVELFYAPHACTTGSFLFCVFRIPATFRLYTSHQPPPPFCPPHSFCRGLRHAVRKLRES